MSRTISLDPGWEGAIALFVNDKFVNVQSMPLLRVETVPKLEQFDLKDGKKQVIKSGPNKGKFKMKLRRAAKYEKILDIGIIFSLMKMSDIIVIEQQSCRPGNGSTQCAKTMTNYGRLLGMAEVCKSLYDTELHIAIPSVWKRDMHITMSKDEKKACGSPTLVTETLKAKACSLARSLFPGNDFKTAKGRMLDGQAEACILGQWHINKEI